VRAGLHARIVPRRGAEENDSPAVALRDQLPPHRAAEQECTPKLHVDLPVPLFIGEVNDLLMHTDARAVDEDVHAPKLFDRAGNHRIHLNALAKVRRHTERRKPPVCQLGGDSRTPFHVNINENSPRARFGEARKNPPAYTGCRAGDDCHFPGKLLRHAYPPLSRCGKKV